MTTIKDKIKAQIPEYSKLHIEIRNDNIAEKVIDRKVEIVGNEKDIAVLIAREAILNPVIKKSLFLAVQLVGMLEGLTMDQIIEEARHHMEQESTEVPS